MFWLFLYNISTPMALACLLGLVILIFACIYNASKNNMDGNSLTGFVLLGILLCVVGSAFWAIPAPDYDVKVVYKDREVIKKVGVPVYSGVKEVPSTYQNVYDKCIASTSYRVEHETMKLCHQQAREASQPPQAVKVVYKPSPYNDLFTHCNSNWKGSIEDMTDPVTTFKARQERMRFCQEYARQGATIH